MSPKRKNKQDDSSAVDQPELAHENYLRAYRDLKDTKMQLKAAQARSDKYHDHLRKSHKSYRKLQEEHKIDLKAMGARMDGLRAETGRYAHEMQARMECLAWQNSNLVLKNQQQQLQLDDKHIENDEAQRFADLMDAISRRLEDKATDETAVWWMAFKGLVEGLVVCCVGLLLYRLLGALDED